MFWNLNLALKMIRGDGNAEAPLTYAAQVTEIDKQMIVPVRDQCSMTKSGSPRLSDEMHCVIEVIDRTSSLNDNDPSRLVQFDVDMVWCKVRVTIKLLRW